MSAIQIVKKGFSVVLLAVGLFSLIGYMTFAVSGTWNDPTFYEETAKGLLPLKVIFGVGIVFVGGGVLLWWQKKWLLLVLVSLLMGLHQTVFFAFYPFSRRFLINGILFLIAGLALIITFYKTKGAMKK